MVEWIYKLTDISSIKRISFRQDINGLRAIAVLAVVFYHAELDLFKGGWLGVDIFFVISGYLISNIIISELNEGTFSFKNFYLRRIRRILPALFSTLLLTIPLAYIFLTPKAMEEYIDSLIASVFFYANYHFMNLDFYVAESTKFMPLLHTWSLAIEEQYYLLFPLLAFLIYKYFRKYFTFFIGFITVGSLYLNTLTQSSDKFYRLEFRIWELLLGVLVMIISSNFKIKHLEKIGLPLMLFPIFYFGDNWINDAEPKLIAIIGISLIIFSNTETSVLTKVLSYKLISIIGLSSYSIYLLHQPLFAFFRIYEFYFEFSISFNIFNTLLIGVILLASILIYFKIEQPALSKKNQFKIIQILIVIFLFLTSYILIYKLTDILNSRYSELPNFERGSLEYTIAPYGQVIGPSNVPKFIIVGDSHTLHLIGYMSEVANDKNFSFIHLSESACFSFINYSNYYNPKDIKPAPNRSRCYQVVDRLIK